MSKKKKGAKTDMSASLLKADAPEFGKKVWDLLLDYTRLGNRCTSSVKAILQMVAKSPKGTVVETARGPYGFLDRGSDVLSVAHIDTVGEKNHFFHGMVEGEVPMVFSPWLDDRLGLFVILDVLPMLGIQHDVLLCTNEENGASSGFHFKPPDGKQWRYIVEFDRAGEDVVNYQYRQPDLEAAIVAAGFDKPTRGMYTDIVALDHLGVGAFNVACGYSEPHTKWCKADLRILYRQLIRYCRFAEATTGITFPFDEKTGYYHNRSRKELAAPPITPPYHPPMTPMVTSPSSFGAANPGPGTPVGSFELLKNDMVYQETFSERANYDVWFVQHRDRYDAARQQWEWSLSRDHGGAHYVCSRLETRLTWLMPVGTDHFFKVRLEGWHERGRPLGYRALLEQRANRVRNYLLGGRPFPEQGWHNPSVRYLWESHGDHLNALVRDARIDYENDLFPGEMLGDPHIILHSTVWYTAVKGLSKPLFNFNDEVEVTLSGGGKYTGVICCLSPVCLNDGEQWYWVDFIDAPDANGCTLALIFSDDITRTAPAKDRWGLYKPEQVWTRKPAPEPESKEITDGPLG